MRMRRALQTTCAISECGVSIRIPTQLIGYPVDACIRFSPSINIIYIYLQTTSLFDCLIVICVSVLTVA